MGDGSLGIVQMGLKSVHPGGETVNSSGPWTAAVPSIHREVQVTRKILQEGARAMWRELGSSWCPPGQVQPWQGEGMGGLSDEEVIEKR